jgi:hypothetical protein
MSPMADLGFSGGGMVRGQEEGCGRGLSPPAGGPGAWPPGNFFCK